MKLLFLIRSLDVGGAERQLVQTANVMADRGHRVSMAVFYGGGALGSELHSSICLTDLAKSGRYDLLLFSFRLLRLIRHFQPDILFCCLPSACLAGLVCRFLPRRPRLVWRIAASRMDLEKYDRISRWSYSLQLRLSRFADRIVVNSNAGANHALVSGYSENRLIVVRNGIDTDRFNILSTRQGTGGQITGISTEKPVVAMVARIDPIKNHACFLDAAKLLLQRNTEVQFLLVGYGDEGSLKNLMSEIRVRQLEGRIHHIVADENSVVSIYNRITINTLTSNGEGFPNTLAEAMACGVVCVATDVGDVREIVGNTGTVCATGDAECIADAWDRMLRKKEPYLRNLGLEARQRIVDNFSIRQSADQLEHEFFSIAGRKSNPDVKEVC